MFMVHGSWYFVGSSGIVVYSLWGLAIMDRYGRMPKIDGSTNDFPCPALSYNP
jgi:hypothetical protein